MEDNINMLTDLFTVLMDNGIDEDEITTVAEATWDAIKKEKYPVECEKDAWNSLLEKKLKKSEDFIKRLSILLCNALDLVSEHGIDVKKETGISDDELNIIYEISDGIRLFKEH